VKGLQNVAVMLGSGKAYRIQYKEERRKQQQRVAERRKMREERRIKRNNSHNGKNDTPQEP
jgi:hypothetical protein